MRSVSQRAVLISGMVLPMADYLITEAIGLSQDDFSLTGDFLSELGEDDRPTQAVISVTWSLFTLLMLPFCRQLFVDARNFAPLKPTAWCLVVFVMCHGILNVVFPCDPGC